MTCPRTFAAALAALVLSASAPAAAECRDDRDCKGSRVCENGQCVEPGGAGAVAPAAAAAPAGAAATAALRPYEKAYGQVGAIMSFHGWGGFSSTSGGTTTSGDLSGGFWGGVQLAGYYVSSPELHLGGYFTYFGGDGTLSSNGFSSSGGVDMYSLGFTAKLGKAVNERVWLGAAGNLGVLFANFQNYSGTCYGVLLHPRFHAEFLLVDQQGLKITAFGAFGPLVVPYYAGTLSAFGTSGDVHGWLIGLQLFLGLSIGL